MKQLGQSRRPEISSHGQRNAIRATVTDMAISDCIPALTAHDQHVSCSYYGSHITRKSRLIVNLDCCTQGSSSDGGGA
jgi:hypothetical protein